MNKILTLICKIYNRSSDRRYVGVLERLIKKLIAAGGGSFLNRAWSNYIRAAIDSTLELSIAKIMVKDLDRFLQSMAIVLRSADDAGKGIVLVKYSYAFPLLSHMFDLEMVTDKYHLVLEPSWTGYCDSNILCLAGMPAPVFVQSLEPKDSAFLLNTTSNMFPVEIGSNWWVDDRIFRPSLRPKDMDICINASWARFKRHEEIFRAVSEIKQQGRVLSVLLIGYSIGEMSSEDILHLANNFGIGDQIEIHEKIPSEKVAENMARCKVNIVWSKREGVNRAIVEGFFCDVPGILREGFNYGHKYNYINEQTGLYSNTRSLKKDILDVIDNQSRFRPRQWVLNNMTCSHACEEIGKAIAMYAGGNSSGEEREIKPKTNTLDRMVYYDAEDETRFLADYEYLKTCYRKTDA